MRVGWLRFIGRWSSAVVVAGACLVGAPDAAFATASEKAAAEALFDEALKLMEKQDYAAACKKLQQSQQIEPGIGTMFYLAECFEKAGRTASAWAQFREAASAARAAGQTERARKGQERADALEGRLSKMTVRVPTDVRIQGLEIRRGGEPVQKVLWGTPIPVDPGEHQVEATAPGHASWSQLVRVSGDGASVAVEVPKLEPDSTAAAAPAPAPAAPVAAAASTPAPAEADSGAAGSTQRTVGFVVGGVGAVGAIVGTIFGVKALQKNGDAEDLCEGTRCFDRAGVSLTDEAKDAALIANIGVFGGLALVAGGTVLILTAPKGTDSAGLRVGPTVARKGGGLSVGGSF